MDGWVDYQLRRGSRRGNGVKATEGQPGSSCQDLAPRYGDALRHPVRVGCGSAGACGRTMEADEPSGVISLHPGAGSCGTEESGELGIGFRVKWRNGNGAG